MFNFYDNIKQNPRLNPNYDSHKIKLPFRSLIACSSGNGKSNLVMNLLVEMTNTFTKIIVCTKEEEPLYDFMKAKLKDKMEIYYHGEIPELKKMPKDENGIVIFDDLVLDKKPEIGQMYIRGRKLGYSSIYISQSFYHTESIIRKNCNLVWLGRGMMARDLRLILSEFSLGLSKDELTTLYNELTATKMNFMLLDLEDRTIRQNIKDIVMEF